MLVFRASLIYAGGVIVDLQQILERVLQYVGAGVARPPSVGALQRLTELAFWSSLERYEGRETRFRFLLGTDTGTVMLASLPEPREVPTSLTRQLAAASGNAAARIVVRESGDGWVTSGLGFAAGEEQLWVDAISPGLVRIGYSRFPAAIIEGGRAFFLGDAVNSPVTEIASLLAPDKQGAQSDPKGARRFNSATAIRQILDRMRRGHGGTLVVLPTRDYAHEAFAGALLNGPSDPMLLPTALINRVAGQNIPLPTQAIADMANCDGAVVITRGLEFVRAGAKISASSSDFEVETIRPTEPSEKLKRRLAELGGTRHQSAARLVFAHREVVAFVCSSDGPVSAIAWSEDDDEVKVTQHLEWMLGSESVT